MNRQQEKDREAAHVKAMVRRLWAEMWTKDGRKTEVFAFIEQLRNITKIGDHLLASMIEKEFVVTAQTAKMMVASWSATRRGDA